MPVRVERIDDDSEPKRRPVDRGVNIKRDRRFEKDEIEPEQSPPRVSWPLERVTELILNPTDEKLREYSILDRIQVRLLPQLDVLHTMWGFVYQIACYRENWQEFGKLFKDESGKPLTEPSAPDLTKIFIHRTLQYGKSQAGKSLERGIDITLAEIERGNEEQNDYYGPSGIEEK